MKYTHWKPSFVQINLDHLLSSLKFSYFMQKYISTLLRDEVIQKEKRSWSVIIVSEGWPEMAGPKKAALRKMIQKCGGIKSWPERLPYSQRLLGK